MLIPRLWSNLQRQSSLNRLRYIHHSVNRKQEKSFELKSINDTHATILIDGREIKYDWIFLRDSCECNRCIDSSTKQKIHSTTDIPTNISPKGAGIQVLNDQTLEILWNQPLSNGNNPTVHRSLYSRDWLRAYSSSKNIAQARYDDRPPIYWNRNLIEQVNLRLPCHDYLHTDEGLYTALEHLNDYGLVFLDNVPNGLTVEELVERIGVVRSSFYGPSWDVRRVEQAINVAYTSDHLGPHMDLMYFEAPPGLQYLHVLQNSAKGGASYYVDSFYVAEILRKTDPKAFQSLCSYPVTFHYRNINRHYHFTRSTIVLDRFSPDNRIAHINYSPPFQAPFESDTSKPEFREFIRAFQHFRDLIDDKANQFELVLEKNQCVIFNNRRVLHARRKFDDSTGSRWLKGCYTDFDNFKDRLRVFREKYNSIQS